MHGLLITFDCAAPIADLSEPFIGYAEALRSQDGLLTKIWISTDSGYGGFHVFGDRSSAESYLQSELAAGLMATDGFDNFEVQHFGVIEDLSALTGWSTATA